MIKEKEINWKSISVKPSVWDKVRDSMNRDEAYSEWCKRALEALKKVRSKNLTKDLKSKKEVKERAENLAKDIKSKEEVKERSEELTRDIKSKEEIKKRSENLTKDLKSKEEIEENEEEIGLEDLDTSTGVNIFPEEKRDQYDFEGTFEEFSTLKDMKRSIYSGEGELWVGETEAKKTKKYKDMSKRDLQVAAQKWIEEADTETKGKVLREYYKLGGAFIEDPEHEGSSPMGYRRMARRSRGDDPIGGVQAFRSLTQLYYREKTGYDDESKKKSEDEARLGEGSVL